MTGFARFLQPISIFSVLLPVCIIAVTRQCVMLGLAVTARQVDCGDRGTTLCRDPSTHHLDRYKNPLWMDRWSKPSSEIIYVVSYFLKMNVNNVRCVLVGHFM